MIGPNKVPLSVKQEHFCVTYAETQDTTIAYQVAYDVGDYKASVTGGLRLFGQAVIQARIAEIERWQYRRCIATPDRVIAELARIAFFDPRQMFDKDGKLMAVREMDDDTAAVISGFEAGDEAKGRAAKIRLADKAKALESLARILGLYNDKVEVTGKGGGPVQVQSEQLAALNDEELATFKGLLAKAATATVVDVPAIKAGDR